MIKLLCRRKDGGPESKVWGYWLIEIKRLFSIVLLHFDYGSREVYHSHAFDAWSWVLTGELHEHLTNGKINTLLPSFKPVFTGRDRMHKVYGIKPAFVLSFRGPWRDSWYEFKDGYYQKLTHGRVPVNGQR